MKYLGIDYGRKKIGLALGNSETRIATPIEIIEPRTREECLERLRAFIKKEGIDMLVIGIPELSKDLYQQHYEEVKEFSDFVKAHVTVPVIEVDESFTTKEAGALLGKGSNGRDDAVAAMLLVQYVLDADAMKR